MTPMPFHLEIYWNRSDGVVILAFIALMISCLFDSNILIGRHQRWTLIFYYLVIIK
jgi:hypothetical protein